MSWTAADDRPQEPHMSDPYEPRGADAMLDRLLDEERRDGHPIVMEPQRPDAMA